MVYGRRGISLSWFPTRATEVEASAAEMPASNSCRLLKGLREATQRGER